MKKSAAFLLLATPLLTSFNQDFFIATLDAAQDGLETADSAFGQEAPLYYYVGSNVCWRVDKQRGVVSALSLVDGSPLWSSDGVVYRAYPSISDVVQEIPPQNERRLPATEIFGRVYFFLDEVGSRREFQQKLSSRRDDLLIALNPNAQGRLVWKQRARDFAPFFPTAERRFLRFLTDIKPAPNDELIVCVQAERETKRFALNAANGEARLLEDSNVSQ